VQAPAAPSLILEIRRPFADFTGADRITLEIRDVMSEKCSAKPMLYCDPEVG